jgi:hypothetical protein
MSLCTETAAHYLRNSNSRNATQRHARMAVQSRPDLSTVKDRPPGQRVAIAQRRTVLIEFEPLSVVLKRNPSNWRSIRYRGDVGVSGSLYASVKLRVTAGSTGMPGPVVVDTTTFFR